MKWLFALWASAALFSAESAVTYGSCGGRFGDFLLHYLHAKWFAYERGLPLLYKPFAYSSELMLDLHEPPLPSPPPPGLFVCPYFPEVQAELDSGEWSYFFKANWKDPEFRRVALELIAPKKSLKLIHPPEDKVSVAIHYREGGGYDPIRTKRATPLKFPSMQFYADALRKIADYFPGQRLYCFVFTDALNPSEAVSELERAIFPPLQIDFDYRREKNGPDENVLEDFFSLFHFDVLIRPASNFSIVPSLLHDYAIVYSLERASVRGIHRVEAVKLDLNEEAHCRTLQRVCTR